MENRKSAYEILEAHGFDVDELLTEGFSIKRKTIHVWIEGKDKAVPITTKDLAYYYAHDARNIVSGCRSLASIVGDWRPIDELANACLEIYKVLKLEELRRECKKLGLIPKF